MTEPPKPGFPPDLLILLARLVWAANPGAFDASGLALGTFGGTTALYVCAGELWASGPLPATSPALGPFLVSEVTAHVIQRGNLATDGALVFNGQRYRVQALLESGRAIAQAIVVA